MQSSYGRGRDATRCRGPCDGGDSWRVTGEEYTPYGDHPAAPELTTLRLRAEQCCREDNDAGLLELVEELRGDTQMWPHLWGPSAATTAKRVGRVDAGLIAASRPAVGASISHGETVNLVLMLTSDAGGRSGPARVLYTDASGITHTWTGGSDMVIKPTG